jgi:hypothetical protein
MHGTAWQGRTGGQGGIRKLFVAAFLCALTCTAQAGDHDHIGIRVGAGLSGAGGHFLSLGAAVDVPVGRALAVFVDGQFNYHVESHYEALTAGVRVAPWPGRKLSPYVSAGAGVWDRYDGCPIASAFDLSNGPCPYAYGFAALGASMRLSRGLTAYVEVRLKQFPAKEEGYGLGMPVLIGVRLGF